MQTITIQSWCTMLIDHTWRFERKVSWAEYKAMSQYRNNEGTKWRAII